MEILMKFLYILFGVFIEIDVDDRDYYFHFFSLLIL